MTPEEEAALLEQLNQMTRQRGGKPPASINLAPVPVRETPDIEEAAFRARSAAADRFALTDPAGAQAQAEAVVQRVQKPQPEVPNQPSLGESVARAYLPKVVVRDRRDDSPAESYIEGLEDKLDKGLMWKSPIGAVMTTFGAPAAYGIAEAALDRDLQAPLGAEGARVENGALWLMRTLLGTAGSAIIEGVERLPYPDLDAQIGKGVQSGRSLAQGNWQDALEQFADAFWMAPSTFGEEVVQVKPGELQRLDRKSEGAVPDFIQGFAERVEKGSGLEEDLQLGVTKRLGPEAGRYAWWLGLGLDAIIDWEGALVSAPRMLARGTRTAQRLADITPQSGIDVSDMSSIMSAIKGHEISYSRELGERIATALEKGEITLEQLPPEWRLRIDEVALGELGAPASELMRLRPELSPVEPLPDFSSPTAADFFAGAERFPEIDIQPGEGFRRIQRDGQAVDDPEVPGYILRDASGQTLGEPGSLQEVAAAAGARGARGDQVWQGDRPVAVWRETESGPELVPHPWFAGPREARSAGELRNIPHAGALVDEVPELAPAGREADAIQKWLPPEDLPEFRVTTAADFYRNARKHPSALIEPGEGFRRMKRDVGPEAKDEPLSPVYTLRNSDGDMVVTVKDHTLLGVKQEMARRSRRGDQIWQGNRPVAIWREEGGPTITPHPWFAGPQESRGRGWPARAALSDPPSAALPQTIGSELLRVATGAPPIERPQSHMPVDEQKLNDLFLERDPELMQQALDEDGEVTVYRYGLVPLADIEVPKPFIKEKVRNIETELSKNIPQVPAKVGRGSDGKIHIEDGNNRFHVATRRRDTHLPVVEQVILKADGTRIPSDADSIIPEIRAGSQEQPRPRAVEENQLHAKRATRNEIETKLHEVTELLRRGKILEPGKAPQLLTLKQKKELKAAQEKLGQRLAELDSEVNQLEQAQHKARLEAYKASKPAPEPETIPGTAPDEYGQELGRAFGPRPPDRLAPAPPPPAPPPPRGSAPPSYAAELLRAFTPSRPPKPTTSVPPIRGIVRRAARLIGSDSLFTDQLRMLSNTALVPKKEAAKIEAMARAELGVTVDEARKLIQSKKPMPAETRAKLGRFVPGIGEVLTTRDWMDAKNLALEAASRTSANVRYRVQGMRPLREQFLLAFKDPHVRRRATGIASKWQDNSLVYMMAKGFTEDKLARLPVQVRTSWKKYQAMAERNADEFAQEIKKDGAQGALDRAIERYRPVHPEELERADSILRTTSDMSIYQGLKFGELHPYDRQSPLFRDWKHKPEALKQLLDSGADTQALTAYVRRWSKDTINASASAGKDWLKSAAASAGRWKESALAIEELPAERARAVYEEINRGEFNGPATTQELAKLGLPTYKPKEALVYYGLHLRERAILSDMAREMVGTGHVVAPDDPRMPTLQAVLTGNHRDKVSDRWVYRYSEAETTWALGLLRDWGIEPGAGTAIGRGRLGTEAVVAPQFLLEEIDSLMRAGTLNPKSWTLLGAYQTLNRVFKESVTHGVIAPRPAYLIGQAFGMLPTLLIARGMDGLIGTGTAWLKHPLMSGQLLMRMNGADLPLFRSRTPDSELFRAGDNLYSIEQLEATLRQWGLHESRAAFEVGEQLQEMVAKTERTWFDPRNIARTPQWWQEVLRRVSGSIDMSARVGTFLDELSKGKTLDEAAQIAKASTLDYRAMTAFEQKYMRAIFTFYAYLRKNADAYTLALINNPGRVGFLGRTAHASFTETLGLTGVEQGAATDQDVGRLAFKVSREVIDGRGRPNPDYAIKRITTPPIGPSEYLGFMSSILPWKGPGGILGDDWSQALGYLSPILNTLTIPIQGRLPGKTFQTAQSNTVPPVLMDTFGGTWLAEVLEIGPEPLTPDDDPALQAEDASHLLGAPAKWAAGNAAVERGEPGEAESARQLWQMLRIWFGAPLAQAELAKQSIGWMPTAPYMTQSDATRDLLLGTKTRPVLAEHEVLRRRQEEQVKELNRFGRDIGLPQGVGPR